MDITRVINEGIELQKEIDLIKERVKIYRKELEKIEDLFKEVELVQKNEYEAYSEWKSLHSNKGILLRF